MSTSPIVQTKALIGYQAATQRPRCGSCQHALEDNRFWTCKKHGLMVTVYAVCDEWTQKVPHGFKGPET